MLQTVGSAGRSEHNNLFQALVIYVKEMQRAVLQSLTKRGRDLELEPRARNTEYIVLLLAQLQEASLHTDTMGIAVDIAWVRQDDVLRHPMTSQTRCRVMQCNTMGM